MWLCHESIYQGVYQPGSPLIRPQKVVSPHRSPLRSGRDHRRAHQRRTGRRPRFAQPMLSIHHRPFDPGDRSQPGHWEGDLIVGKNQASVIGTLVERQTRLIRLLRLPSRDSDSLREAITTAVTDLPPTLVRSITWDQGIEMAPYRHHRRPRCAGLLLRFPLALAAREQREQQRPAASILSQGHRPQPLHTRTPPSGRGRDQQPAPTRSRRPQPRKAFHRPASLSPDHQALQR